MNTMAQQMTEFTQKENMQMLKNLVFVSLISADNDKYPEEVKQEIMKRREERPGVWEYIFEPLGEDADKFIKLMYET